MDTIDPQPPPEKPRRGALSPLAAACLAIALVAAACASRPGDVPSARAAAGGAPASEALAERCRPIPGLDGLLEPGVVLLLGELHGTEESPAFLVDVACHAVAAGLPTLVGLELSPAERQRVDAFLASAGSRSDRRALLAGDLWQRDYQDGRASAAMSGAIEGVRRLRREDGPTVDVLLFDAPYDRLRDARMAEIVVRGARQNATGATLILTGNFHSRVEPRGGSEPMGLLVAEAVGPQRVVSLDVAHRGGTAWLCLATPEGQQCGSARVRRRGPREEGSEGEGISRTGSLTETGHHGWYRVGPITASPPAKTTLEPAPKDGAR